MSKLAIEDEFNDIISKAMAGLRIGDRDLAEASGVDVDTVRALARGQLTDETSLPKIAPPLNLDPNALLRSALKSWYPRPVEVDGLRLFASTYKDMVVNAFLVWDPASKAAAIFDTGTDAFPILDAIEELELKATALFITHTHNDHIAEADSITSRLGIPAFSNNREPYEGGAMTFDEGAEFEIGALKVGTRTTWGHAPGGTTYVVDGLEQQLAVVGDAMFAGSMGGGLISYADALRTNREQILTLDDNTVICPGHGPMTTVGEEKRNNPFFPEFK
ncbi:MAG: MBL fold metallo-hydrolase [Verrucomicrobiota bacterium]